MRYDDNGNADFPSELGELFVALLNLLVEGLVLNLELLKIDQMESICQLLLFLENLFAVGKLIAQLDVLQAVLMHLGILGFIGCLPVVDHSVT